MPKIGKECEGRLRGLNTLFMSHEEARKWHDPEKIMEQLWGLSNKDQGIIGKEYQAWKMLKTVSHIYVSDYGNSITPVDPCIVFWEKAGFIVTIDVGMFQYDRGVYPKNVTFMVRIKLPCIMEDLRADDQIKFEGSYDRTVLAATLGSFTVTAPEEFDDDIEIPGDYS